MAQAIERVLEDDWLPEQLNRAVAGRSWPASAAELCQVLAEAATAGAA